MTKHGPKLCHAPSAWAEILRTRAAEQPDAVALTFLENQQAVSELTYGQLAGKVQSIAAWLADEVGRGERVVLAFPAGLDFVATLWACLAAGVVAVPSYPPDVYRQETSSERIAAIVDDARAKQVLTTSATLKHLERFTEKRPLVDGLPWVAIDELSTKAPRNCCEPSIDPQSLAIIQYTSGSTDAPRGVMVSHANLLAALGLLALESRAPRNAIVGWVPLYHDLGLLGLALCPIFLGIPGVLLSPFEFLQHPVRWLRAIAGYRGTLSGAPNFAYELCARRVTKVQRTTLDLSCWDIAINGAEPIRTETIDVFASKFGECGFRRAAFYPAYGLTEATLPVAGGPKLQEPRSVWLDAGQCAKNRVVLAPQPSDALQLAGCGRVLPGTDVRIVDHETMQACASDVVGEIWVRGPQVALGYWRRPEETNSIFHGRLEGDDACYLRTGDLGFLHDGELFVTGRLKDLIIVNGRNFYPQDLESTAERSHTHLRAGSSIAFSIDRQVEAVAIVLELRSGKLVADAEEVLASVARAVATKFGIRPAELALVRPGVLLRTTSGKLRRQACREAYVAGGLSPLARWPTATDDSRPQQTLVQNGSSALATDDGTVL